MQEGGERGQPSVRASPHSAEPPAELSLGLFNTRRNAYNPILPMLPDRGRCKNNSIEVLGSAGRPFPAPRNQSTTCEICRFGISALSVATNAAKSDHKDSHTGGDMNKHVVDPLVCRGGEEPHAHQAG